MDLATQILVIIVSVVLVLFLALGITVLSLVARLIKDLRRLIAKAEQVADNAAQVSELLKDASGPLAVVKVIRNIIKTVHKQTEEK